MKKIFYYFLGLLGETEGILLFFPIILGIALLIAGSNIPDFISDRTIGKLFGFWIVEIAMTVFGIQGLIYIRLKKHPIFYLPDNERLAILLGFVLAVISFTFVLLSLKTNFVK